MEEEVLLGMDCAYTVEDQPAEVEAPKEPSMKEEPPQPVEKHPKEVEAPP
jgi:hypothetical protein